MTRIHWGLCALSVVLLGTLDRAQVRDAMPYDHIHLTASDPEKAYEWYLANLDGRAGENPGRLIFEPFTDGRPLPVQLLFIKAPDARPSEGSVIESIGFSVADVAAKVKALEAAGARVASPVREVPGLWRRAAVVDPWGVTIELVEDHEQLGFHHITLRVADPSATTAWLLAAFGGERVKIRGTLEALRNGRTYGRRAAGHGNRAEPGTGNRPSGVGPRQYRHRGGGSEDEGRDVHGGAVGEAESVRAPHGVRRSSRRRAHRARPARRVRVGEISW